MRHKPTSPSPSLPIPTASARARGSDPLCVVALQPTDDAMAHAWTKPRAQSVFGFFADAINCRTSSRVQGRGKVHVTSQGDRTSNPSGHERGTHAVPHPHARMLRTHTSMPASSHVILRVMQCAAGVSPGECGDGVMYNPVPSPTHVSSASASVPGAVAIRHCRSIIRSAATNDATPDHFPPPNRMPLPAHTHAMKQATAIASRLQEPTCGVGRARRLASLAATMAKSRLLWCRANTTATVESAHDPDECTTDDDEWQSRIAGSADADADARGARRPPANKAMSGADPT